MQWQYFGEETDEVAFADTSPGSLQPLSEDVLLDALSKDFTVPSDTSSPVSLLRVLVLVPHFLG